MDQYRIYNVLFSNVAVSAQQDLFSILPTSNKPIAVVSINLFQISDVGDAAEEILPISIITGHTTVGSGGTAATPVPVNNNTAAVGFTARVNDTTVASAGTAVTRWQDGLNVRQPYQEKWLLEERIKHSVLTANSRLVVRLIATPADPLSMYGCLTIAELI